MFCVILLKFCDVEKETVNNVLFSATGSHVLSRNPTTISVKIGLVENVLGGAARKICAVC
jgi:hypothetical protein